MRNDRAGYSVGRRSELSREWCRFAYRSALVAGAFVLAGTACSHASRTVDGAKGPRIVAVAGAEYSGPSGDALETACRNWRLSDRDVARFFELSERYEESPYSAFYQVPCSISGRIEAEGEAWEFVIDGGGTAIWSHENETRYFGCSAQACESLVLMPTDLMNPE